MDKLSLCFASVLLLVGACPLNAYEAGKFYSQGHTRKKVIALSFDDGPGPFTPKILDYLKQHHIRATFFMLGDQVPMYHQFAKQVKDAGHEIGNHTFTHTNFNTPKTANQKKFAREVDDTQVEIEKATGIRTTVLRMPNGAFGKYNRAWLLPTLKEKRYALVHWTFGEDWKLKLSADQMAKDYIAHAQRGGIFLMHDGGRHREKTFAALQVIVPALEQQGYKFVACEDLLNAPSPPKS